MWSLRNIAVQINLMLNQASVSALVTQIQQAIGSAMNQANAAAGGVNTLNSAFGSLNATIGRFYAFWMGRTMINAISRFVEESVMLFGKFDQKIQQSVAILEGVTAKMREQMSEQARVISRELNIPAEKLAESYYFLASAGLNAEQAIAAMPAVAAFAKAGMMDLAKATEYMTQVQAALGLRSEDATENLNNLRFVMDVITVAAARSQATIEQFAEAFANKAGASLRVFGKDVREGASVLAVMADQGVKGRLAGERLDQFLRQASLAAIQHEKVFKQYGIQVFDTSGEMRNMADIVADLTRVLGPMTDKAQVATLQQLGFQVRTVAVVRSLIGMEEQIRKYQKAFEDAGGATDEMARKQLQTPIEKLQLIQRKLDDVRMDIGKAFIPALMELRDSIGNEDSKYSIITVLAAFAKWLAQNSEMFGILGNAIIKFAVGALGLLIDTFHILGDAIVTAVNIPLMGLGVIMYGVTTAAYGLVSALGALASALGLDVGDKLLIAANQMDEFRKSIGGFLSGRSESTSMALGDLWNRLAGGFGFTPRGTRPDTTPMGKPVPPPPSKGGTEDADIEDEKRIKKIDELNDRLTRMLLSHTKTRTDNEMFALEELEKAYEEVYGKSIPDAIKKQLAAVRDAIGLKSDAERNVGIVKDYIESEKFSNDPPGYADMTQLMKYIIWLRDLQKRTKEGSDAWHMYKEAIEEAQKALARWQKEKDDADEKEARENRAKKDAELEKRMRRIRRVGEHTAETLADAFGRAMHVLLVGTKRASDAFEQLGRVIAASMLGALAEFFMIKAKENFISAAEQVAKGFGSMGTHDYVGARAHFVAAGKFAAVGAMWSALGGTVGGVGGAIGGSQHGMRPFQENAADDTNNFQQAGTDINIYIDGVDPGNPRHQELIGKTADEYAERTGGNVKVMRRSS